MVPNALVSNSLDPAMIGGAVACLQKSCAHVVMISLTCGNETGVIITQGRLLKVYTYS